MTDKERMTLWDQGWKSYMELGKKDNPDYPDGLNDEEQQEWIDGWLTAKSAEEYNETDPQTN